MNVLSMYCPAAVAAKLFPRLAQTLPGVRIQEADTRTVANLSALRCLRATLEGTSVRVRSPFAFPFLDEAARTEFKGGLHRIPGVDWLFLGGSLGRFVRLVSDHLAANRIQEIVIRPFERLIGSLSQRDASGDIPATVPREVDNYNQSYWERAEAELLALPEERWGEVGTNTADSFCVFEPHIRRVLVREPRLIVDIGCGLGQTARSLAVAFPNARVVGFDASPQAINVARRAFRLPNLEFHAADASGDLGLPREGVDLVISCNALMYARDQQRTAQRLFASLHPDGACLNNCRVGASHAFWDFPRGLLLPNMYQLEPVDWIAAAEQAGFMTDVRPTPSSHVLNPHFFCAGRLDDFKRSMEALRHVYEADPPKEYAYHHSHAFLIHSRHARGNARKVFFAESHPERVSRCVKGLPQAQERVRMSAIIAWLYCLDSLRPLPEAVDFIRGCLPGAEAIVDMVFGGAVREKLMERGETERRSPARGRAGETDGRRANSISR